MTEREQQEIRYRLALYRQALEKSLRLLNDHECSVSDARVLDAERVIREALRT